MDGIIYRNKTLKVKEKNNNFFSGLNDKEIKSSHPKAKNIFMENEAIISFAKKNDLKIGSSYPDKKNFSEQLEMLKTNDNILLFEKINESLDKIVKYKTIFGKENEIPMMLSYYYFSK